MPAPANNLPPAYLLKKWPVDVIQDQHLQAYVEAVIDQYKIPALSIAVWYQGQLYRSAAGVLNIETGVMATPDSLFQIGSITKVFTTTMIMQLVDAGNISLDAPVKQYLRDFQVGDPEVTANVTIRQLLNHSSGLAGDFIPDDPPTGGNPIARYVDRCCLLPQAHPLGEKHSYSNAAFTIAGRLIEVVMGMSWFDAVETQLIKPLGLSHSFVNPQDAPRFRSAMGHDLSSDTEKDKTWQLASSCYPPIGQAPAGTTLSMSATDLITFARAHLDGGRAASDECWLSAELVKQMQQSNIILPTHSPMFTTDWGLGWFLIHDHSPDQLLPAVVGHDGATRGQAAMLRLIPEQNFAFAVQINCLRSSVLTTVFNDLMDVFVNRYFKQVEPSGALIDPKKFTGTFDSFAEVIEITVESGDLMANVIDKALLSTAQKLILKPLDTMSFAVYSSTGNRHANFLFTDSDDQGRPVYLSSNFRLHRRV